MTDEDGAFVTFHPSRLMGLFDMLNTDSLVDLISGLGAPKQKILMTLPAKAYKFTLKNKDENAPRSETTEKEPVPIDRKQVRVNSRIELAHAFRSLAKSSTSPRRSHPPN